MSTTQGTTVAHTGTDQPPELDRARAEAFAGRLLGIFADACTGLMLSAGHRAGLFDALEDLPPSSSAEIAQLAGLNERYVREWLGGMLVAGVVTHDRNTGTWTLPREHAASLARSAGSDNLSHLMQFIGLLAGVEQQLVTCFREGGGVPYGAYTEFHALMAEDSSQLAEGILIDAVVPLVDGLAERLADGISVADIGCGSGHHLNVLAAAFPASSFVGYDFSEEAITEARATAATRALGNVRFELRDVSDLSGTGPFDLVTAFDAIHDQAHPAAVLAGIAAALAPGGVFLMVDVRASSTPDDNIGNPMAPSLYAFSTFHCMPVSLALGGAGLGAVWGEQTAVRMLHEAGFSRVQVEGVEGDFINSFYVSTIDQETSASRT
jgi:2-polyprenyl-3-methyl-5-hydroxy-6-metoxy-1,4-benzoquinol methylase